MADTEFKHNGLHLGILGAELSTSFDRGHECGRSEARVSVRGDGRIELDVSRSAWAVYGVGKTGRTNTRSGAIVLNEAQVHDLISALTHALNVSK